MSYIASIGKVPTNSLSISNNYVAPIDNPNITAAINYLTPKGLQQNTAGRADSLLQNVGGELSGLTHASSGIEGLMAPQIAQQMDQHPTSMLQNQLQTTMGIPPALLQKMMMAQGAIPDMLNQNQKPSDFKKIGHLLKGGANDIQNAVNNINFGFNNPMSASQRFAQLGSISPKTLLVPPIEAAQGVAKLLPYAAYPFQAPFGGAKDIASEEKQLSPLTHYNITKKLGIPNTAMNRGAIDVENVAEPLLTGGLGAADELGSESAAGNLPELISAPIPQIKPSQQMANQLISTAPRYYSWARNAETKAYAPYNAVLDDPDKLVDDEKFQTGEGSKQLKIGGQLNEVNHILTPEQRSTENMSIPARKFYKKYLLSHNGRDLARLNRQLGNDSNYGAFGLDTNGEYKSNLAKDGWNKTKQILEDHAEQNGVLKDKQAGDDIHSNITARLTQTEGARDLMKGNLGPRTPQRLSRLAEGFLEGENKLSPDNPFAIGIQQMRNQMELEKNPALAPKSHIIKRIAKNIFNQHPYVQYAKRLTKE